MMQLILIDDVFQVGKRGQVVEVASGYGRNYLIPKKLAIPATAGNLKMVEQQRLAMAKKEARFEEEAQLLAEELERLHVVVSRKSGETGTLFGSVTSKDVARALGQRGIQLDRRKILLHQPIKAIGNYQVELRLHSEVAAKLLLSVIIEGDEPIAKVKEKDEESDRIVVELEAKLKEIEQLAGVSKAAEEAADEDQPRKSGKGEQRQEPSGEEQSAASEERGEAEEDGGKAEAATPPEDTTSPEAPADTD